MSAPQQGTLPNSLLNNSAPIAEGEVLVPEVGNLHIRSYITHAWRMFFSAFVQTSVTIDPNWTTSVSSPPTQAEVEAIRDQVSAISQVLGRV